MATLMRLCASALEAFLDAFADPQGVPKTCPQVPKIPALGEAGVGLGAIASVTRECVPRFLSK
jgi:hypothetical protein